MLALIIADRSFAQRERLLLSRLEVGLADEGVRVIHAAPASVVAGSASGSGLQSTIVPYDDSEIPLLARPGRTAMGLLRNIDGIDDEPLSIDIVHAFGAPCWPIAMEVARARGAGVLLELWNPGLVEGAANLLAAAGRRGPLPEFLTSEPAVGAALTKREPRARVYSAPWGVHSPTSLRALSPLDRPLSMAVLFDRGESACVAAALGGLVAAGPTVAEGLIEMSISEGSSAREGRVWSAARKAGLLERASILADMEARRDPVLEMDLLLVPEANGWERTLVLEAMGCGMGVIAAADPALEILRDGTTARLVGSNTPGAWAKAIRGLAEDRKSLGDLRASAHSHIHSQRSASAHIEAVLRAYRQAARPVAAS